MMYSKLLTIGAAYAALGMAAIAQAQQVVIVCSIAEGSTCGTWEGEFNHCDSPCDDPSGGPGDEGPIVLFPTCPSDSTIERVNSSASISGLRPAFSGEVGHETFASDDVVCVESRTCTGCAAVETMIGGAPVVWYHCKPPEDDSGWTLLRTYQNLTPDGDGCDGSGEGDPIPPHAPPPPPNSNEDDDPANPIYPNEPHIG